MSAPVVEVRHVSKNFIRGEEELTVLDDISLEAREREILCIVGPSGCGKSTLLRMIDGLDHPTMGEILFRGEQINTPNPKISIIFQTFALLPWKTVLDNVEFGLEMHGIPKDRRKEIAMKFIRIVGLEGFENSYPKELSGGMKQRVGIARALATDPDVLLMDEPFSALDALTADTLRREVLESWSDPSIPPDTIIMVTHLVQEAVFMADRIIVMSPRPGRIIGEVKVKLERPRNVKSEEFFELQDEVTSMISQSKLR